MRVRLVHGFSQTPRSWDPIEARLPRDWDVQALDVPDGLDFVATAGALGARGGPGAWVGYSMGGRLVLQLAIDRPGLVERLVLISASPGIRSASERSTRRGADERLAQEAERDGVRVFLERWLAQRLFETLPPDAAMIDDRCRGNTVQRLAHQLRSLGQGTQEPLWDRLGELDIPVLLVTGAWDRAYTECAEQMAAAIGSCARVVTIPKAGHAVHSERPDDVAAALTEWMRDASS
jgi:2-succinyl-6-hydroxy-2,4-cyclohexadiene-1-carboxylate synthase